MGKSIVYCGDCGTSLREQDFDKGAAREIDRQPFCTRCRPSSPSPAPAAAPVARTATARIPKAGTARRHARRTTKAVPLAAGAAGLALLAVVAVLLSAPAPEPERARPPSPVVRAPSPVAPVPSPAPPPPPVSETSAPPVDPALAVDRWLEDVRQIRRRDPEHARAAEVRSLLRQAAERAGPRRGEVEALLAKYEKEIARPTAVAPPPPPPAPEYRNVPPPKVLSFSLIYHDVRTPVPGYEALPPDAVIDLARIGPRAVDIAVNTEPRDVGSVGIVIDGKIRIKENTRIYSITGGKPALLTPGEHTVTATPWSLRDLKGTKGATAALKFTVVPAPPTDAAGRSK